MSIWTRLLLLVSCATLLPALLIGVRFYQERSIAIDDASSRLFSVAEDFANSIDERIKGTAQLHYGLSRARDLETEDKDACSRFLSNVREEYPQYTGILTINPDGSLFCDSLMTGRTLDLRDRGYFREALEARDRVTLEPAFGRLTGTAVLQIAYPVRSEQDALRFILLASLNLHKIAEDYKARPFPGMQILFVDHKGTVLVWTPREGPGVVEDGASIASDELFRFAGAARGRGTGELGEGGDTKVWAVARPEALDHAGLYIMVGVPKTELQAGANSRFVEDAVILAAIVAMLFFSVWLLADVSIRKPVARIVHMVRSLGAGALDARIPPPHPKGELGDLMADLNGAAESLERQRSDIVELNEKLRQSQRLESVGQLTGGVAHDFNNLLTVIMGNAEQLSVELAEDKRRHALAEVILSASVRGAELTHRLLAFARKQALDPKVIDVNQLIRGMDGLLRRTLGEHVEVEVVRGAGLWKSLVDPGQLENAILNLCLNGRDAMPQGGKLTIETSNVRLDREYVARFTDVQPGQYVMVAVSDTGKGIQPEHLDRVFEPFYTTKETGKGTGLGLAMVYGFIKQSGGHANVYSEPGHGTSVKLYVPRAEDEHASETVEAPDGPIVGGTETILVVEDDEMVREYAVGQLSSLGYTVIQATNGTAALSMIRSRDDIDLLFTDVVMPGGMSGRQLVDEAMKLRPGLKALYTSGYTENAIVHGGRLDKGVHLLGKPYRRQELALQVRSVLDQQAVLAEG